MVGPTSSSRLSNGREDSPFDIDLSSQSAAASSLVGREPLISLFLLRDAGHDVSGEVVVLKLPFIRRVADKIISHLPAGAALDADDLIQEGSMGLLEAFRNFDLEKGILFETYAEPRVRGAMIDALRGLDTHSRLDRQSEAKVNADLEQLKIELGTDYSLEAAATHLGLSVAELEMAISIYQTAATGQLDSIVMEYKDSGVALRLDQQLEDRLSKDPGERLERMDLLRKVFRGLNQKERLVLISYYLCEESMKEVGEQLGLSESRVSQLHTALIKRLQNDPRLGALVNDREEKSIASSASADDGAVTVSLPEASGNIGLDQVSFSWTDE
ncbi:MAG: sigma-70 family RNA polymerase sigma factor [Deltaproteobacteria bacterium]|nr:sigma-70 family RNA polymerase sigma factor [Deltaproteobacteria bacterium]